jgi:hypothetical protein
MVAGRKQGRRWTSERKVRKEERCWTSERMDREEEADDEATARKGFRSGSWRIQGVTSTAVTDLIQPKSYGSPSQTEGELAPFGCPLTKSTSPVLSFWILCSRLRSKPPALLEGSGELERSSSGMERMQRRGYAGSLLYRGRMRGRKKGMTIRRTGSGNSCAFVLHSNTSCA